MVFQRDTAFHLALRLGMRRIVAPLAVVALLSGAGSAWADFDDGMVAAQRGDYATALREFRPLAEQGDANAQFSLGIMYDHGYGVPENDTEALKWWRKAAEQGYANAQYSLGLMYRKGRGVPENHAEAVKWYRTAAEQGHVYAQHNLGEIYAKGIGVPRNYVKAYMWISLAKAQGHKSAVKILNIITKRMTPAQINKAQNLATNWRQASSQQGSKRKEQKVDLEAERKALNEKLTKIMMKTINWTPLEVTEGTLDNPGPPISQTCPPDVAKRIQEVSEEEFTKLLEQISGDLAPEISSRIMKKLDLSEARLAVDTLEKISNWPEEDQKAFQETDLAKRIQQLVLPEIIQSLKSLGQKFSQLAPGIFNKIEVRLETEGIIKVSEHNWCLQD